jgi:hypothetical protein
MKHLLTFALSILLLGCVTTKDGAPPDIRKEVAVWTQDLGELILIAKPEYRVPMEGGGQIPGCSGRRRLNRLGRHQRGAWQA